MNARIYKKQAKRCIELLHAWGGWGMASWDRTDTIKLKRGDDTHPILGNDFRAGTPVYGAMIGYYEPEWSEYCPRDMWIECHYWSMLVPEDFNGENENLPVVTLQQRRERLSTRMLPKGWRWRGKRAVKIDNPSSV